MSGEANEVLVQEIDGALEDLKTADSTTCASHKHVCTALTVLLRCEKARLQADTRILGAAGLGGSIGGAVMGAASYLAAKYFGQ